MSDSKLIEKLPVNRWLPADEGLTRTTVTLDHIFVHRTETSRRLECVSGSTVLFETNLTLEAARRLAELLAD